MLLTLNECRLAPAFSRDCKALHKKTHDYILKDNGYN